jgi:peroxiredoxin family protein
VSTLAITSSSSSAGSQRFTVGLCTDAFERVHYALVLAVTAAAVDRSTSVFFAGGSVRALTGSAAEPGWQALAGAEADTGLTARGLADMETLIESASALGVKLLACELALAAADITPADIRADLTIEIKSALSFIQLVGPGPTSLFL